MKLCKCGCNLPVTNKNNSYLWGHHLKLFKIKHNQSDKTICKQKETIRNFGKGFRNFCLCGCGQKVKHPHSKYCLGHNQKHKSYQSNLTKEERIQYGRKISKSKLGKTKETNEGIRKAAEKITGLTKENCEWRRRAALSQSITMKKNYEDPEFLKKVQKWLKIKPNYPEKFLIKILNDIFPNIYKYTGDFSFWIGRRNPDFTNEIEKKVIEFFGEYYHGEKYRKTINDFKTNEEHEKETIEYYKNHDYKCLVIWWKDLKNIVELTEKIIIFHNGEFT
jgi:hypothetical protein